MLIVAVSSRALFNLEDGHAIFEKDGLDKFDAYMRENEKRPLRPGVAFTLVKKLLALNSPGKRDRVTVMLLSSNTPEAGARVMHSVTHFGLDITRAVFTSGGDRFNLAKAARVQMFLSTNPGEVRKALDAGLAAACVMPRSKFDEDDVSSELCIAFDGDSVLFSDEAEQVYQQKGLKAFIKSEVKNAHLPLAPGPFKPVLSALHDLQMTLTDEAQARFRVALVTARSLSVHERVQSTFREWGVKLHTAAFLDGDEKGPYLDALAADIFLDDGMHNVESAARFVPAGHVPAGIVGSRTEGSPAAKAMVSEGA